MTIALEQLGDSSPSDRNFLKLMSLVPDTGGRSVGIRFGTGTVTWPGASPFSTTLSVTHGLGRTPVVTFAGDAGGGTLVTNIPVWSAVSPTATSFSVAAETNDISSPAVGITRTFYWMVIG